MERDYGPRLMVEQMPENPAVVPEVVPLLVTDNLESASVMSSSRIVKQLSLSLAGAMPQIAGKGQIDKYLDDVDRIMGEDLNSLITTARLSENIFRVRFGANRQGSSPYAMVPQTHRLFLLVLVPRKRHEQLLKGDSDYCQILAMTRLRDRRSGKEVPMRNKRDLGQAMARAVYPLVNSGMVSDEFMNVDVVLRLAAMQMSGDFQAFTAEVDAISSRARLRRPNPLGVASSLRGGDWMEKNGSNALSQTVAGALWLHISQVWSGSVYSTDVVELDFSPVKEKPKLGYPPATLPWALLTDGRSSVVRVSGFTNLDVAKDAELAAVLKIKRHEVQDIIVPVQSVGRLLKDTVSYEFGRLDELLGPEAKAELVIKDTQHYPITRIVASPPTQAPGSNVSCSTQKLVPDSGGEVSFTFSASATKADAFKLKISGATVVEIDSKSASGISTLVEESDGVFIIKATSLKAKVRLSNVVPDDSVTISLHETAAHTENEGVPGSPLQIRIGHPIATKE